MNISGCARWIAVLLMLLLANTALAVTYTFRDSNTAPSPTTPTICSGAWSKSGSTFTCAGNLTLASGDVLIVRTAGGEPLDDITVVANNSISLTSNSIGTSAKNISLRTTYGTVIATGSNTINGSVRSDSGAISLSGTTLNGALQSSSGAITLVSSSVSSTLTSSGVNNLTNSSISGAASISSTLTASGTTFGSTVTTTGFATFDGGSVVGNLQAGGKVTASNGVVFGGTLTSTSGSIDLTGGSVVGLVRSNCCSVTTNGTDLSAGARSDSDRLSITGGTIAGTFYAGNNPAIFSGVTMTSGTVSGASTVTFNDSYLGSAESKVTVTSASGEVILNNSIAFGDFKAPNSSTIRVNSPSSVTGTCLPNSTPANACNASVTPVCFTDNFDGSSLNSADWVVTTRSGSFGNPRVVNNRLRLTDSSTNVATAATLQRLLPADSNYVQVQFSFNAYGGNGADGVAVVFSDASVAPQPGSFGGPLGYGTKGSADTTGFAGGWLGVGLDEYGNFSNEGGPGSVGARQDSVAIRGSGAGTSGYRYLAGTAANLNPGIDISGTTPGPGHIYRITLDSTVRGKTMVRVERKVGSGNFTTLISSFDVRGSTGQVATPNDFYLSLTGSTGSAYNIHELDNLQICATRMNPIGAQIDHIRIEHDGSALTCQPETVTVKACMDANCTSTYPDPVTVTLSPATGWVSGNSLALTGGVGTGQYRRTTVGDVTFGVTSVSAPLKPFSTPKCANGGALSSCPLSFVESGFIFDVPNMVANTEQTVSLQAVRKSDTSQLCVPAFESGTRTIKFWSTFDDPVSGTRKVAIENTDIIGFNRDAITGTDPGTGVNLTFGPQARASFRVRYADAGQMRLNASYKPTSGDEAGLVMLSGTDTFIARPAGLCVYSDTANSDCAAGDASCSKFVAAGDPFRLRVGGVAWEQGSDDDLCSGNLKTPNYRQVGSLDEPAITLSHTLVAPSGGITGNLVGVTSFDIAAADAGEKILTDQSISEVGVFTITATPPTAYLGGPGVGNSDGSPNNSLEVVSTSTNIGRFYPAYLAVARTGATQLSASCVNPDPLQSFSYQGQRMGFASGHEPGLEITGHNRQGNKTTNYDRGAFWRLSNAPERTRYTSVTGVAGLDELAGTPALPVRLQESGTLQSAYLVDSEGDGTRTARWSDQSLWYSRLSVPNSDDQPFPALISLNVVAAQLRDADGVCHTNGSKAVGATCQDYFSDADSSSTDYGPGFGGSEVRLGRVRSENVIAPVGNTASVPIRLEHWGGSLWVAATDGCTELEAPLAPLAELEFHSPPGVEEASVEAGDWGDSYGQTRLLMTVTEPNSPQGSVWIRHLLRSNESSAVWLCRARGDNEDAPLGGVCSYTSAGQAETRSSATFGIYKGAAPLIFRREIYGQ